MVLPCLPSHTIVVLCLVLLLLLLEIAPSTNGTSSDVTDDTNSIDDAYSPTATGRVGGISSKYKQILLRLRRINSKKKACVNFTAFDRSIDDEDAMFFELFLKTSVTTTRYSFKFLSISFRLTERLFSILVSGIPRIAAFIVHINAEAARIVSHVLYPEDLSNAARYRKEKQSMINEIQLYVGNSIFMLARKLYGIEEKYITKAESMERNLVVLQHIRCIIQSFDELNDYMTGIESSLSYIHSRRNDSSISRNVSKCYSRHDADDSNNVSTCVSGNSSSSSSSSSMYDKDLIDIADSNPQRFDGIKATSVSWEDIHGSKREFDYNTLRNKRIHKLNNSPYARYYHYAHNHNNNHPTGHTSSSQHIPLPAVSPAPTATRLLSWNNVPGLSTEDKVPSISPHLLVALIIISIISSRKYKSVFFKYLIMLLSLISIYYVLHQVESTFRRKIVTVSEINAINSFIHSKQSKGGSSSGTDEFTNSLNKVIDSIWIVNDGGLGLYASEIIEDTLKLELQVVPASIANLKLEHFTLGTNPPVIRSIDIRSACSDNTTQFMTDGRKFSMSSTSAYGMISHNKQLLTWLISTYIKSLSKRSNDTSIFSDTTLNDTFNADSSASIHSVVLDMDVAYVSKDMDIVFNIRSTDLKSVIPDTKVKVTEFAISGNIRLVAQLIPEYPFFGNSTVSFLELPILDMGVSSFGGVDISSFPGVYNWLNVSMTWILSHYTSPLYKEVDLKAFLCPTCVEITDKANGMPSRYSTVVSSLHSIINNTWTYIRNYRYVNVSEIVNESFDDHYT